MGMESGTVEDRDLAAASEIAPPAGVNDEPPRYRVAVRTLCEFTARQGDLNLHFTPTPSAEDGIEGHRTIASRRAAGYRSEVSVEARHRSLLVRGRIDGYDAAAGRLEEFKTYRGDLSRVPANHRHLHWAQARVYGWLLCLQLGLDRLDIALVYFDIDSRTETPLVESCNAQELRHFFETQCERFLAWAEQESSHRSRRDAALQQLTWPLTGFRRGQREFATAVFNAARSRRRLLAQAPTGIGKTMATLFPLLKATPAQGIDKIFFLTAKTSGRALALDAMAQLRTHAPELPLRTVALVARDIACEHPDRACHGESCPLARGFYDRLPAARAQAIAQREASGDELRVVARSHHVCPYYLTQELARWADVVVADVNYFFDTGAPLHAATLANQWRVGVLVDEAHNLVDRARAMHSATLDPTAFAAVRASAPVVLKRPLDRLQRQWRTLARAQTEAFRVCAAPPQSLVTALQQAAAALGEHLAHAPESADRELLQFYFDALHFLRVHESSDAHWQFDITLRHTRGTRSDAVLCLRNVVPAPVLRARLAAAHSAVLFSATLQPFRFYTDMLGLPDDTVTLDVDSPFDAAQLGVKVARHVSTRYADRGASLPALVALIAHQFAQAPGNYLAFFSSFEYLEQALGCLRERHPGIATWVQTRGMMSADRERFLGRFVEGGQGVGFAVLGGAFGEGVDLPGSRLVGAFIATLGLPPLNPVNEALRDRMQALFGAGYDYVYLYPGLQKVVQAAGRVIRGPEDRGVVHLIDDRFARRDVRRLLPAWWVIDEERETTAWH